jgi:glycine cleavage system H lipoate-binding protein
MVKEILILGWIAKIEISNTDEVSDLMNEDAYEKHIS